MNQDWKAFLITQQAHFADNGNLAFPTSQETDTNRLCALTHLAVLTVSGNDAAQFLQGQITCNINDITDTKASLGAFCNAKGRTISTFLLVKTDASFALIMPQELLETVRKKLQMYILRSQVTLTDSSHYYCLIGLSITPTCDYPDLPKQAFDVLNANGYLIKLPATPSRYLLLAEPQTAIKQWSDLTEHRGFLPQSSDRWRYLDILAGLPWLTTATSEAFIPQMLNLDRLGGISFNKGCYTGQEIIARTHYLGNSKRALFLAAADAAPVLPGADIIGQDGQKAGTVLTAQADASGCKMLVVLSGAHSASTTLSLDNQAKNAIRLLS
ncbi:MAG: folate-binding protein [Gammaproteobacteria bacterium HGW-Gammaproteobacteria-3]|nr:MAG: folate-binding protein [Gammaproteobacteria bacterium HGW-Gammaproteobacteria-3]